ncbi:glycosyltransferase family 4 protein [Roseimicrobium sp. ORNL1]|uniref:glycosyltransferase family 4 protein n=1 Tax=Roseimicrobium sp. ORNL1 TaxID=2711231 RepID=UPI0013E1F2BF|nr:glycosyltransferase family 4 protein [Roseimicrobium sp. ORNL1]QIF02401.1 glycosyltransferase family 4 protein [Roseimicrobium sp. ORNL1]
MSARVPVEMKRVLLVSLHTLDCVGGGEAYTLNTALSISSHGDHVWLASPVDNPTLREAAQASRMDLPWIVVHVDGAACPIVEELPFSRVLELAGQSDVVWIHQYLGSPLLFDFVCCMAPDQPLLMTSLGFEAARHLFEQMYQPAPNHWLVEISPYALERHRVPGRVHQAAPGAGIWRNMLRPHLPAADAVKDRPPQICAVGRVMPHKAFEITIEALPEDAHLHLIGPARDDMYCDFLRRVPTLGKVVFTGEITETEKLAMMDACQMLVASSSYELFDGRRIDQPELLGLVLLEAVARGVLPVASDIPPFRRIMEDLGLADFLYPERDVTRLKECIESIAASPAPIIQQRVSMAQILLQQGYLWDDYWERVREMIFPSISSPSILPAITRA